MSDGAWAEALVGDLHREYGPMMLSYAIRVVQDRTLAEDVVQETLIKAWCNAERLVPAHGSVRGWLLRVAHNIAIDHLRSRKVPFIDPVEEPDNHVAVVRDHADDVLLSVWLAGAIRGLNVGQQDVLREVFFHDRTAPQAAAVLGVPVGTVKSRLFYALRELRTLLDQVGRLADLTRIRG